MKTKTNSFALLKWIAENGDQKAKIYLSKETGMTVNALNRTLNNKCTPRLEHRYRIYVATGVSLLESDNFPVADIKKLEAS